MIVTKGEDLFVIVFFTFDKDKRNYEKGINYLLKKKFNVSILFLCIQYSCCIGVGMVVDKMQTKFVHNAQIKLVFFLSPFVFFSVLKERKN